MFDIVRLTHREEVIACNISQERKRPKPTLVRQNLLHRSLIHCRQNHCSYHWTLT